MYCRRTLNPAPAIIRLLLATTGNFMNFCAKPVLVAIVMYWSCLLLWPATVKSQQTFCNPLNISNRFTLDKPSRRAAADPVIVLYKDIYYLFATASGGYWYSKDMLQWSFVTTEDLPFEKDAPAASVINGSLYYMPLNSHIIYRAVDPIAGKWEVYTSTFPMAIGDPDFFQDMDGKVYLYYGCTNNDYLYAIQLVCWERLIFAYGYTLPLCLQYHSQSYNQACPHKVRLPACLQIRQGAIDSCHHQQSHRNIQSPIPWASNQKGQPGCPASRARYDLCRSMQCYTRCLLKPLL